MANCRITFVYSKATYKSVIREILIIDFFIYFLFCLAGNIQTMCSRFEVQGSLLFVTYTIIQGIISSEM